MAIWTRPRYLDPMEPPKKLGIQILDPPRGQGRELLSCTKEILEEACRPESGRPASCKEESTGVKRRLPRVNDTLVRKAIKRIHLWNADGAADGQLAGELNLRSSQLAEN